MSHTHSSQIKLTLQLLHLGKVKIGIRISQIKSSVVRLSTPSPLIPPTAVCAEDTAQMTF